MHPFTLYHNKKLIQKSFYPILQPEKEQILVIAIKILSPTLSNSYIKQPPKTTLPRFQTLLSFWFVRSTFVFTIQSHKSHSSSLISRLLSIKLNIYESFPVYFLKVMEILKSYIRDNICFKIQNFENINWFLMFTIH